MLCMRAIGVLFLSLLTVAYAQDQHLHQNPFDHDRQDTTADIDDIVSQLADESVKAALVDHLPKYRDGIFEGGKKAIETIRQESPELLNKVIDAALNLEGKQDLRKRQTTNSTDTSVSVTTETSTTTSTTTTSSVRLTTQSSPTTTSPTTTSVVVTTESSPTTTFTTSSTVTSSKDDTTTTTSSKTTSRTTSKTTTSTTSQHRTTRTTRTTIPPIITTTHTHGETVVFTYTPSTVQITTIIHRTTKLPDGGESTYTSYKIVVPAKTTTPTVPSIKPEGQGHTTHRKPNLQTGDAARTGGYAREMAAVFGVALGVAAMI